MINVERALLVIVLMVWGAVVFIGVTVGDDRPDGGGQSTDWEAVVLDEVVVEPFPLAIAVETSISVMMGEI